MTERELCVEVQARLLSTLDVDEQDVTLGPEGSAVLEGEFTVSELCRIAEAARVAQVRALQLKGVTPLRDTDDDAALFHVHQLRQAVDGRADHVALVDAVERSFWRVTDLMIGYGQQATASEAVLTALTPLIGHVLADYEKLRKAVRKRGADDEAGHLAGDQAVTQRVDVLVKALTSQPTSLAERAVAWSQANTGSPLPAAAKEGAAYSDAFGVAEVTPARGAPMPAEKTSILESVSEPGRTLAAAATAGGFATFLPPMSDEEVRQAYLSEPGGPEGGAH